ncbi:MAG: type II and III secretion system protein [Treponema sp.]|nr:type II and III secretion system protein [Treponema sp.]
MEQMDTWKKRLKLGLIIQVMIFLFPLYAVGGKESFSWDFSDCEIKDILYAVSLDTGISIVPDDTVSGRGDLKFTGRDFYSAFDAFLLGNRLFVKRDEKMWVVSRFNAWEENGLFYLDACDLLPSQILEKLSVVMDFVITYDSLSAQKISVHLKGLDKSSMIESLARVFGNYEVKATAGGVHVARKAENWRRDAVGYEENLRILRNDDGSFLVDVKDVLFSEVVERLFSLRNEGPSFCVFGNGEVKVQRSVFCGFDFDGTLEKLCSQNSFGFFVDEDIYYFYADVSSKNALISKNRRWQKFPLRFAKSKDLLPVLSARFSKLESIVLQNNEGFICNCTDEEAMQISQLIGELDVKKSTYLVHLKYIQPKELMDFLPPDVDRDSLFMADDSSCLYFNGTEAAYEDLCEKLAVCDRPSARLSYDLLILQYDDVRQNQWASNLNAKVRSLGDRNNAAVSLGSVMSLNLNVVAAFGLSFAAGLQASIEENRTKVFADTTLHGVSGKQIAFQSTNTYRYRDNNVDPDTGKPVYSGVTREISSGIKLDVLGWVSGNGVITTKVSASVSRQGIDTSSSTGNPPPTTEKLVTTEVNGKSGEPIVLSGLVQDSDEISQKRTPFISKVPLLGWFFKNRERRREKSQMIIYLVPHLLDSLCEEEDSYDEEWLLEKMKKIRSSFDELTAEESVEL